MIYLPFEGRRVEGSWENRRGKRDPQTGSRRTVIIEGFWPGPIQNVGHYNIYDILHPMDQNLTSFSHSDSTVS